MMTDEEMIAVLTHFKNGGKVLTADQWYVYDRLMPLRNPQKMHATASQCADEFLLTLVLWEVCE